MVVLLLLRLLMLRLAVVIDAAAGAAGPGGCYCPLPRSTLACPQDSAQMQLVVKYPEVLATDASAGTNSSGLLLAFLMATCDDLKKRPVCIALLPGETVVALGFMSLALQLLVKIVMGNGRLNGVRAMLSDQAPATLHVHRLYATQCYPWSFGGASFTPLTVRAIVLRALVVALVVVVVVVVHHQQLMLVWAFL
jgi:hypothetical protein